MGDRQINQKLIVPLFNLEVDKPLDLALTDDEFVERLKFYVLDEPITVLSKGAKVERQNNEPIPTPLPVPIPTPKTIIHILPWRNGQATNEDINKFFPIKKLPVGFDVFDNLGPIAFRAGCGGLGGFQTVTTASTKQHAKSLLMIEFDQSFSKNTQAFLQTDSNLYEHNLTDSFLDGLRLSTGNEPHQHKGFHIVDNQFVDSIIKWPLMEIQGTPIRLTPRNIAKVKDAFLLSWQIRTNAKKSKSCKIINLALEYYYLSSTITETRTTFLYLMIAFEALFKTKEEDSASAASSNLAKLLATTKEQYNEIMRFMWNTKQDTACCQVRNQIVHGETSTLSSDMYWRLRELIRVVILRLGNLVLSSQVDGEQYYESLRDYVGQRFKKLPNN